MSVCLKMQTAVSGEKKNLLSFLFDLRDARLSESLFGCLFYMSLPHGVVGWSAVYDCDISLSCSMFNNIVSADSLV